MTSPKILIVEDEALIALAIEQTLLSLGYRVIATTSTGEAALETLTRLQPDLVLMDIWLEGAMDGIQAAAQIQKQFNLPVIFLTAYADEQTLKRVKTVQPSGYLLKPFRNSELQVAVEIALSRHRSEVETKLALTAEQRLNQQKSEFVAMMSHEFRNPLSSIQIALELLRAQPDLSPDKKSSYFQRAQNSIEYIKKLLEQILILGQCETSQLQNSPSPINILAFCQEIVEEFQLQVDQRHRIQLQADPNLGTMTTVSLDANLLRHVLTNLLSNAIKYSPNGGHIDLSVRYDTQQLIFQIQDEGIGIPETDQTLMFTPFFRGQNIQKIPGTGLGLAIVKLCVEAQGGQIDWRSQEGCGTTFTVRFPLIQPLIS